MRSALLFVLLLSGCPGCDQVAPDQPPNVVGTGGAPAGSPCEQACARRTALGCSGAGAGCVDTCERYEEQAATAPALGENPACQAQAASCAAADACRGH